MQTNLPIAARCLAILATVSLLVQAGCSSSRTAGGSSVDTNPQASHGTASTPQEQGAPESTSTAAPQPVDLRVLFIGNSQTQHKDYSIPEIIEALSASAPPDRPRIQAEAVVHNGYGLTQFWQDGEAPGTARARIAEGGWSHVVLQEIYNVYRIDPDAFTEHAGLFSDLAQQHGGIPVVFATSSIYSEYPKGFARLNDMQIAFAASRQPRLPYAAAGYAWLRYLGDTPEDEQVLSLYNADQKHPSRKGAYLNACLLYALITGASPVGLTTSIPGWEEGTLSLQEGQAMQNAAWEQYRSGTAMSSVP